MDRSLQAHHLPIRPHWLLHPNSTAVGTDADEGSFVVIGTHEVVGDRDTQMNDIVTGVGRKKETAAT